MHKLKTILNVMMALLILWASAGFTLHQHHCMGRVMHMAINEKATNCTGESELPMDMGCCDDTQETYRIVNFEKATYDLNLTPEFVLLAVQVFNPNWVETTRFDRGNYKLYQYKPPLIGQDIPVFLQSFLI